MVNAIENAPEEANETSAHASYASAIFAQGEQAA